MYCQDLTFEVVNAMWIKINDTPIELNYYDECSSCECWTVIYNLKQNPLNITQAQICHRDSLITLITDKDTTSHKYSKFVR
jgi:hypothetical protein